MTYEELLQELKAYKEEDFAAFQRRLIFTSVEILGVRTPILRRLAKKYVCEIDSLMKFPNEYYEVIFIKLCAVSLLPYEQFLGYIDQCPRLIDNWATCDSFKPNCIKKNKEDFLPKIEEIFSHGGEFYERLALVLLLGYYVEEKYATVITEYIKRAELEKYYVHMAVAWLVAELLIKLPKVGNEIINGGYLPQRTHNKAIQKAVESFRITQEEKKRLKTLKIK